MSCHQCSRPARVWTIGDPVGAGGVGEVYRARDVKLGREVSVKVMSQPLIRDERQRRRLESEARDRRAVPGKSPRWSRCRHGDRGRGILDPLAARGRRDHHLPRARGRSPSSRQSTPTPAISRGRGAFLRSISGTSVLKARGRSPSREVVLFFLVEHIAATIAAHSLDLATSLREKALTRCCSARSSRHETRQASTRVP